MLIGNRTGTVRSVALATLAVVTLVAGPAFAATSKQNAKCAATIGKSGAKLSKTITSAIAKCKDAIVAGGPAGACPDAAGQAKIDKAEAKLSSSVLKACHSLCAVSNDISCIGTFQCPTLINSPEFCTGKGGSNPFEITNVGFPGPFCDAALAEPPLDEGEEIGECVVTLTGPPSTALTDVLYGSTPSVPDAAKCSASVSKQARALSQAIYKGAVKCRGAINQGKTVGDPATCTEADAKIAAKIAAAETKLSETIAGACDDSQIQDLDLCGNGVGGTLSEGDATACLTAAVHEITSTSLLPTEREFGDISLVEAAYPPPRGVCGDNITNQLPNPFALIGEECDGTDDGACPGQCLPAGDTYQCTCATRPLIRFFADGLTADLDNGWRGPSHDSGVADGAGYINEVTNCNCTDLTGATCTGTTSDQECDLIGFQLPSCSWDPLSTTSCDDHGNNNGVDKNEDCARCDQYAINAGDFCVNETQCDAQCYDADGNPTTPCVNQTNCAVGEVCRGQCDDSPTCFVVPNGAPLPISSGGTAVCVLTTFRENIFGTRDIVTGEHEVFIQQFSQVNLGTTNSVPCPLCGGFCASGPREGEICEGTCSVSGDPCRFDVDCPISETCTTTSPNCPGGTCNLELVCGGGVDEANLAIGVFGAPCRLEAYTRIFGTTSNDCKPAVGKNISGDGLQINFYPATSETTSLPSLLACTTPGYGNYLCPCPPAGGTQTRPNSCAGACNAGAELGQGCATGAGAVSGQFTTCVGGAEPGQACDEDSDCSGGGLCSANPTHCTGGPPADELKACTLSAECNGGTCVNACPSGRCVPLCVGGAIKGDPPAPDPEEGFCAAGPAFYHCSGEKDVFRTCSVAQATGPCNAVCATQCVPDLINGGVDPVGGSMTACSPTTPCGGGEICCGDCELAKECEAGEDGVLGNDGDIPGGGICIADISNCFVNDGAAEGGDTLNGNGDPTNVRSVASYCIAGTGNGAIDPVAGLGGPGRLRQNGVIVPNQDSIP